MSKSEWLICGAWVSQQQHTVESRGTTYNIIVEAAPAKSSLTGETRAKQVWRVRCEPLSRFTAPLFVGAAAERDALAFAAAEVARLRTRR